MQHIHVRRPNDWRPLVPYLLSVAFTLLLFVLMADKHLSFSTRTYDFGRFDQAIWNTLHGRFLFTTIDYRSILGNHFSPYMALLAPVFLIWDDARALFLIQILGVVVAGLTLYRLVRLRHSVLIASLFLLAFYLNPALHDMTLFEFRRVVLAVPFLALSLYGVYRHKRWLTFFALLLALLCKEDLGLFVFGVGVYLLLAEREWRWGLFFAVLGLSWTAVVSLWVIPLFRNDTAVYPQLFYFNYLGSSYGEILNTLVADPFILLRTLFTFERLQGLLRLLLPLGLILPLLSPRWLIIALPTAALLLFSGDPEMAQFDKWYTAPILPVLFTAVAALLLRQNEANARRTVLTLLATAVAGFLLFSTLPFGGEYDAALYTVTEHDRIARELLAAVPPEASVATQPHYVPHLSHRENIYHYPWVRIGLDNVDAVLLDPQTDPYPLTPDELTAAINGYLANPAVNVMAEVDGAYLFEPTTPPAQARPVAALWDESMKLVQVEVATQDEGGFFRTVTQPLAAKSGQVLRVALYWETVRAPAAVRTVSVRVADATGYLIGQHDGQPAQDQRPTGGWQPGEQIRDVHYLTLSAVAETAVMSLDVVVYDSQTQEVIPTATQATVFKLAPIVVLRE